MSRRRGAGRSSAARAIERGDSGAARSLVHRHVPRAGSLVTLRLEQRDGGWAATVCD
jgi:hypothetical protein